MNELWLPEGHVWDLHISNDVRADDAGDFTGGGWKLCWHTTETSWDWAKVGAQYLDDARKAPHFIIGGASDAEHPYVYQLLPLNRAGRALGNDTSDGYQTNRANVIQVEICGKAAAMSWFAHYRALANLFTLIQHRVEIPNWTHADAGTTPRRLSDREWFLKAGHVGHNMCPDNDHTDPGTGFRWGLLQNLIGDIPDGGYSL